MQHAASWRESDGLWGNAPQKASDCLFAVVKPKKQSDGFWGSAQQNVQCVCVLHLNVAAVIHFAATHFAFPKGI